MATGGEQDSSFVKEVFAVPGKLPIFCDLCERRRKRKPATTLCRTCSVHMCHYCFNGHRMFTTPGEHVFVDITDAKIEKVAVDMKGLDLCSKHDRTFTFVCSDHNSLCCELCLFYEHKKCDDIRVIKDVTADDGSSTGLKTNILDTLSKAKGIIDSGKKKVEEHINQLLEEIDGKRQEIIDRFDKEKECVEKTIRTYVESESYPLVEMKSVALSVITELEELLSVEESVKEHGTAVEKFIVNFTNKEMEQKKLKVIQDLQNTDLALKQEIKWSSKLQTLLNSENKLITLRETPVQDDNETDDNDNDHTSGEESKDNWDSANNTEDKLITLRETPVQDDNETDDNDNDHTSGEESEDNWDSANNTEADTEEGNWIDATRPVVLELKETLDVCVYGLDFLPDGRLVAIESHGSEVFILSATFKRLGSPYKSQIQLQNLTWYKDNIVAVTLTGYVVSFVFLLE